MTDAANPANPANAAPAPATASEVKVELWQILAEESDAIHGAGGEAFRRAADIKGDDLDNERLREVYRAIHERKPTALCLSGGGIRSATFNLGVIQALAAKNLLTQFNFLSTVSGGGFIGSWLSAWIKREGAANVAASLKAKPGDPGGGTLEDPGAHPVRWLRQYSNYLTPQLGLFSGDTWTLVATYFRNLVLNWLIFLPLIAAALMIPRFGVWFVLWIRESADLCRTPTLCGSIFFLLVGGVFQAIAVEYMDRNRPSAHHEKNRVNQNDQLKFLKGALLWLVLAGIFVTCGWAGIDSIWPNWHQWPLLSWAIFVGASLLFTAIGVAWSGKNGRPPHKREIPYQAIAAVVTGSLLFVFATRPIFRPREHPLEYVAFALPLYLAAFLLGGIILRGLTTKLTSDADREWSSRASGWILVAAAAWAFIAAVVLLGPSLILWAGPKLRAAIAAAGGLAAFLTGWLAKSPDTPATSEEASQMGLAGRIRYMALALVAPLFIVLLLIALAMGTDWLVRKLIFNPNDLPPLCATERARPAQPLWQVRGGSPTMQLSPAPADASPTTAPATAPGTAPSAQSSKPPFCAADPHQQVVLASRLSHLLLWFAVFCLIGWIMGRCVNINKYSLHGTYRNRLIRAYLGASNFDRDNSDHLNAFTGFNETDNIPMTNLRPKDLGPNDPWPLFHVINAALNLVRGKKLAWQERKAESFTFSPLHSGGADVNYRSSAMYGGRKNKGTRTRPITLGSAVAISGAAASPNMGYHSSPVLSFIMTLLNVRLGMWLGNPNCNETFGKSHPDNSIIPLFAEAFGFTDDQSSYVYLSDGGHFENLAIYEMVRRRCHCIVAIDAGQDVACNFDDLGNAMRKIHVDLGVPIELTTPNIFPRKHAWADQAQREGAGYCAVARIRYSQAGDPIPPGKTAADIDGWLLYIKPTVYLRGEPMDVQNYARTCADFPHETTADQFFSETQFESYRALGYYIMTQIAGAAAHASPCDLIRAVHAKPPAPPQQPPDAPVPAIAPAPPPAASRGRRPKGT